MHSLRRFALLLAMGAPAMLAVSAQSSSSNPPAKGQVADTPQTSVQARIRLRREQRRATAIHDAYDHRYDTFVGMGYLRFTPGPSLQRLTFYSWDLGVTRYFSQRLGATVEGRGYYGTAFVGLNKFNLTRPAISQYDVMGGPTYRFYMQPKYSIAGRVLGGWSHGNYSGDTNGLSGPTLGLYPDADTFSASAGVVGEFNVTPSVALRLAPEYFLTGYGSTIQASPGFSLGFVYRFGKQ